MVGEIALLDGFTSPSRLGEVVCRPRPLQVRQLVVREQGLEVLPAVLVGALEVLYGSGHSVLQRRRLQMLYQGGQDRGQEGWHVVRERHGDASQHHYGGGVEAIGLLDTLALLYQLTALLLSMRQAASNV